MVDASTDFYKYVDNFAKFAHVGWRCVCGDESLLEKVFVTISIPTYNRPDTLKDAIDSALNQEGYVDYCVMVVDNDSIDGTETEKLIRSYNSENLLYFKNEENTGMFGNQNRCFEIPRSEYVVMLHDDDMLLPNYLKTLLPVIIEKGMDAIQPKRYFWYESKENRNKNTIKEEKAKYKRIYDFDNYTHFVPGSQTCGIFRRTSIIAIGGYNSDYYPTSDYCLGVQYMSKFKLYTCTQTLSIYRIGRNASMSDTVCRQFIINDYYLKRQIMSKCRFPKILQDILLQSFSYMQELLLREQFCKDFCFDYSLLGITNRPSKIAYYCARIVSMLLIELKRWGKAL